MLHCFMKTILEKNNNNHVKSVYNSSLVFSVGMIGVRLV